MDVKERMEKAIEAVKRDWAKIRTGAASPVILEGIMVDYFGTPTPIAHLGNITVPEPRVLAISPWDRSAIPLIEKAIHAANMGINPLVEGSMIRLNMPILTQDRRQELAKNVRKIAEESRVAIRNIRRDENDRLKKDSKKEEWPEDQLKKKMDEVQKLTDSYIDKIDKLMADKEADILKV